MQLAGLIFFKKKDYKNSLLFLKKAEGLYPSIEGRMTIALIYSLLNRRDLFEKEVYIIGKSYPKAQIDTALKKNRDNIFTNSTRALLNAEFAKLAEGGPK